MNLRWRNKIWKWTVGLILLTGGLVAYGAWLGHKVKASVGYHVEARYEIMPEDDKTLESWLKIQPGVARVYLQRKDGMLDMSIIIVQDAFGNPPFPRLDEKSAELGYARPTMKWRDVVAP